MFENKTETLITFGRVVSYWVLLSAFLTGTVVMNIFLWAPQSLTGRWAKYAKAMGPVVINTPPYSWMGFTVDQLLIFGTFVDLIGLLGLLNFPRLAASIVFMMTIWRQVFLRMNIETLPNHPLCGYTSPTCMATDMIQVGMFVAAVFVYTAGSLPLPETTVKLFKLLGFKTHAMDRGIWKLRRYIPIEASVPATPTAAARAKGM